MRDSDIQSAIRKALAGSSSQHPVDVARLYKLGGKAVIDAALGEMLTSTELNTAWTMKDGIQKTLYWLTGVISPLGSNMLVINRQRMESSRDRPPLRMPNADMQKCVTNTHKSVVNTQKTATKVQPKTANVKPIASKMQQAAVHQPDQKKETPMNARNTGRIGPPPSELRQTIYNKIVEHPGITQAALIKHALHKCPDATEKQAVKALSNMRHMANTIRAEGARGNLIYHLNSGVSQPSAKLAVLAQPAKPAKKAAVGKVVFGAEAAALRGDPAPSAPAKVAEVAKKSATPATPARVENETKVPSATHESSSHFSLYLDDLNHLHITVGDDDLMLYPAQTARLHKFMCRVALDGAPA